MIKKILFFVFITGTFLLCNSQTPNVDASWIPVFQDDFTSFDNTRWKKAHRHVHGEGTDEEPQVYDSSNVTISISPKTGDGQLCLKTTHLLLPVTHPNNGKPCNYHNQHFYKSGQINSKNKYQYGYFEIYAKMPVGKRFWPAFWLFNCKSSPNGFYNEIDIMEITEGWNDSTSSNIHWGIHCDSLSGDTMKIHSINNNHTYHWYGLEWTRTRLIWFVDNQIVRIDSNNHSQVGIHHPLEIILNLAMAPWVSGGSSSDYPGDYRITQANVFELQCDTNTNVTIIPDFSTYNYAVKKTISLCHTTTIPSNAKISLRAQEYIELKNGFEIPLGAQVYFEAGRYK